MADVGSQEIKTTCTRSSLLPHLAILLGMAATVTVLSILGMSKRTKESYRNQEEMNWTKTVGSGSGSGSCSTVPHPYSSLVYMSQAAKSGILVQEFKYWLEVGISIARMLSLDGTRQSLVESFSRNAPHILSTVLWVYWGVCISDMIPFYLGRLFKKSGASDDVYSKLGINEDNALGRTSIVQRYGNLIGFVEQFSLGVRNPTTFLAGALGISPECFFAGVCCGGLITLPVQVKTVIKYAFSLHAGLVSYLRERHVFALATVATVVNNENALTNSLLWLHDSGNVQVKQKRSSSRLWILAVGLHVVKQTRIRSSRQWEGKGKDGRGRDLEAKPFKNTKMPLYQKNCRIFFTEPQDANECQDIYMSGDIGGHIAALWRQEPKEIWPTVVCADVPANS
ncbi:SNARE associated Golgi protein [Tanacetum coccineum]